MVNLLHISSNQFPPLSEEHSTKKIWRELSKGFNQYHILARSNSNKFESYSEGNIFLHLVPRWGSSKSFFFSSLYMLCIIKKYNINILLSQCPLFGGVTATLISRIKKIPLMVEVHGMIYFSILNSKVFYYKLISLLIKYTFDNATKVRSLSNVMTKMILSSSFKANVVEIPNRVNIGLFFPPKDNNNIVGTIKIISVGRFVWEKAFDVAIEAIKELRTEYEVELILIGGGPLQKKYYEIAKGVSYIKIMGRLKQEDFVPILRSSDIYIQPSLSEGMPRTILEAMAMGLPVISSSVGAIPGILRDNENGLLVKPGDKEDLKRKIELLIKNSVLRRTIACNGYSEVVEKYEWNKVFSQYRNELTSMLEGDSPS